MWQVAYKESVMSVNFMGFSWKAERAVFLSKCVLSSLWSDAIEAAAKKVRLLAVDMQVKFTVADERIQHMRAAQSRYEGLTQIAYLLCTHDEGQRAHDERMPLNEVWSEDTSEKQSVGWDMRNCKREVERLVSDVKGEAEFIAGMNGKLVAALFELCGLLKDEEFQCVTEELESIIGSLEYMLEKEAVCG